MVDLTPGTMMNARTSHAIGHPLWRRAAILAGLLALLLGMLPGMMSPAHASVSVQVVKTSDASGDSVFTNDQEAASANADVTFQLVITNNGTSSVEITAVEDDIDGGGSFSSVTCLENLLDATTNVVGMTLDSSEEVTCFYVLSGYSPDAGDSVTSTARVTVSATTSSGSYAAFANSTSCGPWEFHMQGAGDRTINGNVHSNASMRKHGAGDATINGLGTHVSVNFTHSGAGSMTWNPSESNPTQSSTKSRPSLSHGFSYFDDESNFDGNPNYFHFGASNITHDDIVDADGNVVDGIYVTRGWINIGGSGNLSGNVTLVASGYVNISGSGTKSFDPFFENIVLLSARSGCSANAVDIGGAGNHDLSGQVWAPNGRVRISGAGNKTVNGFLVGETIDLDGAGDHTINGPSGTTTTTAQGSDDATVSTAGGSTTTQSSGGSSGSSGGSNDSTDDDVQVLGRVLIDDGEAEVLGQTLAFTGLDTTRMLGLIAVAFLAIGAGYAMTRHRELEG